MRRSRGGPSEPSLRQLRVGEELRHAMVWVMGHAHLADPGLAGVNITITEVKVSPDLKSATVFVTPLGGADLDDTVAALNRAAGFLRGQLGRKISLRYTPRISFAADRSFDYAMRVRDLLDEPRVRRDLGAEAKADDDRGADQEGGTAEGPTPSEREEDGHGA